MGMDIERLAAELEIDPEALKNALDGTAEVLCAARENVRPANREALRGLTSRLEKCLDLTSQAAVRERLVQAASERLMQATSERPKRPVADEVARYTARWNATPQVERALEGLRELVELARTAETFNAPPGRPSYEPQTYAVAFLLEFWARDLGRRVSVPAHADDPRGVRPNATLRFMHGCMQLLGEDLTEQACRTALRQAVAWRGEKSPRFL